jgi:hypothetical protein
MSTIRPLGKYNADDSILIKAQIKAYEKTAEYYPGKKNENGVLQHQQNRTANTLHAKLTGAFLLFNLANQLPPSTGISTEQIKSLVLKASQILNNGAPAMLTEKFNGMREAAKFLNENKTSVTSSIYDDIASKINSNLKQQNRPRV